MHATPNEKISMKNPDPKMESLRAKRAMVFAGVALQVALLYGCAGVVARNTTTTPPPGGTPQLSVTPASISFGTVADGTTNSQTVQVKNTGTASLTIAQATLAGAGFSQSGMS